MFYSGTAEFPRNSDGRRLISHIGEHILADKLTHQLNISTEPWVFPAIAH
jgi:hypothetical protein